MMVPDPYQSALAEVTNLVNALNDSKPVQVWLIRWVPLVVVDYDFFSKRILISPSALRLPKPVLRAKILRAMGFAQHAELQRITVFLLRVMIFGTLILLVLFLLFGHWHSFFIIEGILFFSTVLVLKITDKDYESEVDDWARLRMRHYDIWKDNKMK